MNIITDSSDLRLRQKTKKIEQIDDKTLEQINSMFQVLYHSDNGIGLAAPQVGWDAKVFIINLTGQPSDELVFINPELVENTGEVWEVEEGCLSFPGLSALIERKERVKIKALDKYGNKFIIDDAGWLGRCALHELDHLSGILLVDRAKKLYFKSKPAI